MGRKGSEGKIIDIDKKKKRPKDRNLGDTRYNRGWGRVNTREQYWDLFER